MALIYMYLPLTKLGLSKKENTKRLTSNYIPTDFIHITVFSTSNKSRPWTLIGLNKDFSMVKNSRVHLIQYCYMY